MIFDVPTMLAMITITNLVMTIALMVVATGRDVPGLKSMAWALFANTSIYVLYGLQGQIPEIFSVSLPNTLGAIVVALALQAILQLRGAWLPRATLLIPVLLILAASVLLLEQRTIRIVVVNALFAAQEGLVLWALLRGGGIPGGRGRHILVASTVTLLCMFAYRSLSIALGWQAVAPIATSGLFSTITYLAAYLAVVFLAFGFVLAATELAAEQSHRLAMEDALTGLPNRRAVLDALARQSALALRARQALSVLMLDVDHFKQINDRYGHPAGDEVLRQLAVTLRQRLRAQDMAGRFGGEEFLVILPDTTPEGGLALAESLREAIAAIPLTIADSPIAVTASIGLHGIRRITTDNPEEMIRHADRALYRAKANGRDRVELD